MNNQEYLQTALDAAKRSGKVHTTKDFAELVGVDRATISSALNGNEKYLSDKLVQRVARIMEYNGIVVIANGGGDAAGRDMQKNFDTITNPDVKEIVQTLVSEMAVQREQLIKEMAEQRRDFMELLKTQK